MGRYPPTLLRAHVTVVDDFWSDQGPSQIAWRHPEQYDVGIPV